MNGMAEGVDGGLEAAVRVSQGYCIYAGCFPINVIPPPMSFLFDVALTGVASRVPAVGSQGRLGRSGFGLVGDRRIGPGIKFNTATAWTMSDGLGAPFAIGEAADKWFEAAGHLGEARAELEELLWGLSSDQWSGADREAFNEEVRQLAQQIGDAQLFAEIVAWSLVASVFPLGAWPLGCSIIGVIQFVNASMFYAAAASIVGNLGPSPALYASGLATSITCNRSLSLGRLGISGILGLAAVSIVGGAIGTAGAQQSHGDEDAMADLTRAVVEMSVEQAVSGMIASGIDALTPWPLDAAHAVANAGDHIGQNQDPLAEAVDEHFGDRIEDLGDDAGDLVVGDDQPDRGPYSGR